ncbi:hypothetical protein AGMMS49992_07570 [Clostridia bacterium]|nr:hypothetical protein AGMMS49992_07570 [Clostridia bacterium]
MSDILTILWYALLAILGACARHLRSRGSFPGETIRLLSGCMISAFAGIIVFFVTRALHVGRDLAFAFAGISGWIGPQFLDFIANVIGKQLGGAAIIPLQQPPSDDPHK